jgi:hypothetical protein
MLARSAAATETTLTNIVNSTAAVIFLGTPHRGSADLVELAKWAVFTISSFRVDTTSSVLVALALRRSELEAQEAFSRLWNKYDFRVKTFQEGLGLTGINLGVLGNKAVPDYSSLLGDLRERAETIQANHMETCRFAGADDPNCRKFSEDIRSVYFSIHHLNAREIHHRGRIQRHDDPGGIGSAPRTREEPNEDKLNSQERDALQPLWFPTIGTQPLKKPAHKTCLWLFEHEDYQDWLAGRNRDKHYALLLPKGKMGSGKSMLMNHCFRRVLEKRNKSDCVAAAFFFSAKGGELEYSPVGLFRSLLTGLRPERHVARGGNSRRSSRRLICYGSPCTNLSFTGRLYLRIAKITRSSK